MPFVTIRGYRQTAMQESGMYAHTEHEETTVKPFEWSDWAALWQLRQAQLAENGVFLRADDIPQEAEDVGRDDYEWDYHHIDDIYLRGVGGFWLAWQGQIPVGHVGAQDLGQVVELRRMYVRSDRRRRGIGTRLVQALISHCIVMGATTIELWTAEHGSGHFLYERLGFLRSAEPGQEYGDVEAATGYSPGADEIRLRLNLA